MQQEMKQQSKMTIYQDQVISKQIHQNKMIQIANKISNKTSILYKQFLQRVQKQDGKIEIFINMLDYSKVSTKSHLCTKILDNKTKAFKCYNCMYEDNSIICIECFEDGNHKGHRYELIDVVGGCCDCGDDEKWDELGFCKNHQKNEKNYWVQLDKIPKNQRIIFIKQVQFAFYLLFQLCSQFKEQIVCNQKKQFLMQRCQFYGGKLIHMLTQYNTQSLASNLLTYELLESTIPQEYPALKNYPQLIKISLLQNLFGIKDLNKTSEMIVYFYVSLFTVTQFKRRITILFFKQFNKSTELLASSYDHLSCQILTSHRLIKQLVQQKVISPLQCIPKHQENFQKLANLTVRYYMNLNYLSRLYKGSAQIYLQYHIMNSNIAHMAQYRISADKDPNHLDYYGLQCIYINKLSKIIKVIKDDEMVLEKAIYDLYQFIIKLSPTQKSSYYISQERSMAYFIYAYLKGNIQSLQNQKIANKLIKIMGINLENIQFEIKGLLNSVLKVLKFSGLLLGHHQSSQRNFTYFSFMFKKQNILISLDFTLLRIIIYLINTLNRKDIILKNQLLGQCTAQTLGIILQKNQPNDDQSYDRQKALTHIIYFISLLIEQSVTPLTKLILGISIGYNMQIEITNFYYSLLQLIGPYPIIEFKKICEKIILCEGSFDKLIQKNVILQKGKISCKKINQNKKLQINYLKTIKCKINKLILQNNKIIQKPQFQYNNFMNQLFNIQHIQMLIKIAMKQKIILKKNKQLLKGQINNFNKYIIQLLKLRIILYPNKLLEQYFLTIASSSFYMSIIDIQIFQQIKDYFKKSQSIENTFNIRNQEQSLSKKKIQEKKKLLKQKKFLKINQKRNQIQNQYANEILQIKEKDIQKQQQYFEGCIICKQNNNINGDLMFMCFLQKSNLFYKFYTQEINKQYLVFKSCGHQIHWNCFYNLYGNRDFAFCQLCKNVVNILIPVEIDINSIQKNKNNKIINCIQRFQVICALLGNKSQQSKINDINLIYKQIIKSITIDIIFTGMINPQYFLKKKLKFIHLLLSIVKLQSEKIDSQNKIQEHQKCINPYKQLYSYVYCLLNSYLKDTKQTNFVFANHLEQQWINIVKYLGQLCVKGVQLNQEEIKKLSGEKTLRKKLSFWVPPQNLLQLMENIGECGNCHHKTNLILICLICQWKGCRNCPNQSLIIHARKQHCSGTVYIQADSGFLYYVSRKNLWIFESLYQNYLGQPYTSYYEGIKLQNYILNKERYQQIQQNIMQYDIQQTIRYLEQTKKKTYHLNL